MAELSPVEPHSFEAENPVRERPKLGAARRKLFQFAGPAPLQPLAQKSELAMRVFAAEIDEATVPTRAPLGVALSAYKK